MPEQRPCGAFIRGTHDHPRTQGKIERWHQTLKNRILLERHYLPEGLEQQTPDRACFNALQPIPVAA